MTMLDAGQVARATPIVRSARGARARKRATGSVLVLVAVLVVTALMLLPLIWSTSVGPLQHWMVAFSSGKSAVAS